MGLLSALIVLNNRVAQSRYGVRIGFDMHGEAEGFGCVGCDGADAGNRQPLYQVLEAVSRKQRLEILDRRGAGKRDDIRRFIHEMVQQHIPAICRSHRAIGGDFIHICAHFRQLNRQNRPRFRRPGQQDFFAGNVFIGKRFDNRFGSIAFRHDIAGDPMFSQSFLRCGTDGRGFCIAQGAGIFTFMIKMVI